MANICSVDWNSQRRRRLYAWLITWGPIIALLLLASAIGNIELYWLWSCYAWQERAIHCRCHVVDDGDDDDDDKDLSVAVVGEGRTICTCLTHART